MIIDFHTHTFPEAICEKVLHKLSMASCTTPFTRGSESDLLASMKKNEIAYSVTLPVMTNAQQVEKINHNLCEEREASCKKGLISFGGMHPEYEEYKKELAFLKDHGIKGIKLHPAYQCVDLDDIRMMRIIDAASELGLIVLIHAGIDVGIYDHNYSSTAQILKVIDTIHPEKFVLAHMGNWGCWEEVESDLCGAPVFFDTAFSLGKITAAKDAPKPPILSENLSNEAFARIVTKHGASKILFATDSPWEDQGDYLNRLQAMPITQKEKEMILGLNAKALLSL